MGDNDFREAFQDLFVLSHRVAFRILGHAGESEDVAAEALARTLRKWPRVRGMASREGWVTRVTTNLAIDVLRRRKSAGRAASAGVEAPVIDDPDVRVALRQLLRALPRRQCEVLALRYLADLSEGEVATTLGISVGTVKKHSNRGLARLRQRLEETDDGGNVSYAW